MIRKIINSIIGFKIIDIPYVLIVINLVLIFLVHFGVDVTYIYKLAAESFGYSIAFSVYVLRNEKSNIGHKSAAWACIYSNSFNLIYLLLGYNKADYFSMYSTAIALSAGFVFTFILLYMKQNDYAKRS